MPSAAGVAGWLPEAVPVAVAGFGIPAMALLLLGRFQVPPGRLDSVPQQPQDAELRLWVGVVLPDGTVRPLPAQG